MLNIDLLSQSAVEKWNTEREAVITDDLQDHVYPNLFHTQLSGLSLQSINLYGAQMNGVDLRYSDLTDAYLVKSRLLGTSFAWANLTNAVICESEILGSAFHKAKMVGCDLSGLSMRDGDISQAVLHGSNLCKSIFSDISFAGSSLCGATLDCAIFSNTAFSETDMTGSSVSGTVFSDVDMRGIVGLDTVKCEKPAEITLSTFVKSEWQIPEVFLRVCGIADDVIAYAKSRASKKPQQPIFPWKTRS